MTEHTNQANQDERTAGESQLLGAADVRRIAGESDISPTKKFGQNFVIDPGTVRRIVREAGVTAHSRVLEVGPGLGSLTLALLETGAHVTAVEIDPSLAQRLPETVAQFMPDTVDHFTVIRGDALNLSPETLPEYAPTGSQSDDSFMLVSNLPYNVATPILLTLLERFDNLDRFLVMVQKEVADRLAAKPGSKIYGTPSVKLAWYGRAERVGLVGRNVFWPIPNVDSALVSFVRYANAENTNEAKKDTNGSDAAGLPYTTGTARPISPINVEVDREQVFQLIDTAFGQRRKTLHAALKKLVPEEAFKSAGIDPTRRGETLTISEFAALAGALQA
ncbi:16S rRNA (adenine1518-N6/adenine1519-N6)-dimethyltransferase [Bifidobacterium commune]|uniref:Ribosomal RNA small subunit methyltransferase A n=1 Tax=Bifidobacterium commune TaxID=1505727 RepID=A0A1C4H6G8_9BIFI|nr:16S rRNA (adenine(1518)-N(6)/adenine(1519)-N(6))-dimethyltransferase RsmA [Bifidobacterium commune]MBB2955496.1 16S rRNA (adenine1518-N6/adenine1519-N6)-dimethyltransferase [Bifidobacterium commune]SCC80270.1 dimethyladenosine transferase [Bifidobacterium commune]